MLIDEPFSIRKEGRKEIIPWNTAPLRPRIKIKRKMGRVIAPARPLSPLCLGSLKADQHKIRAASAGRIRTIAASLHFNLEISQTIRIGEMNLPS
jgi:hypothetical protein